MSHVSNPSSVPDSSPSASDDTFKISLPIGEDEAPGGRSSPLPPAYDFGNMGDALTEKELEDKITERAKSFEPAIKRIVGIIDSASCKAVANTALQVGYTEEQADRLAVACEMEPETKTGIATPAARILARRVKSAEAVDWICLIGAVAYHAHTIKAAIDELKASAPNRAIASLQTNSRPANSGAPFVE